ncbi:hypothetical protein Tco_1130866 [Tanacetum coccineum]
MSAMSVNDLYQPWRAILSMINMCLTGKTAGHDRPRHPVLQILWGIIHGSNIDYAERIWEEFHNIHTRTGSPLHYLHDENVLGNLRFVGKDGWEVFEHGKAEVGVVPEPPAGDKASKPKSTSSHLPKPKLAPTKPSKSVPEKKAGLVGKGASLKVPSSWWMNLPKNVFLFQNLGLMMRKLTNNGLRFQPLPKVQGNGKEKVIEEQTAHDLLTLQTLNKKSLADQFIFQRRTPMTTEPSENAESPSLDAELAIADIQDEGHVGSDPGKQDEGQAGSNPGNATVFQPQLSHVVHARPNLEPMDLAVFDSSTQQNPEQLDEEFTTTAYPNVQENLKLPTKDHVILEEPASSTGTLSSLQYLEKELSFTDQFFMEKPREEEPEKTVRILKLLQVNTAGSRLILLVKT